MMIPFPRPMALALPILGLTVLGMQLFSHANFGLNTTVYLAVVLVIASFFQQKRDRTYLVLAAFALWFTLGFSWREADSLHMANLAGLLLVACLSFADRVNLYPADLLRLPVRVFTAPFKVLSPLLHVLYHATGSLRFGEAGSVAVGILWSLPLIALFGSLLTTADLRFAGFITGMFDIDLEAATTTTMRFAFWMTISAAFLLSLIRLVPRADIGVPRSAFSLPAIQVISCLVSLNVLFISFLMVQVSYFFGGDAIVIETPGETYANYARRGFWELVYVAMLIVPVLYAADWLLRDEAAQWRARFFLVAAISLTLIGLIELSAAHRMVLLVDAYNLTVTRFYAIWFMLLILSVLITFCATVLRSHRERFIRATAYVVLAFLACLPFTNPDALVARINIAGESDLAQVDDAYLRTLSMDAYPVLIDFIDAHQHIPACRLIAHMEQRIEAGATRDWRDISWSSARALDIMEHRGRTDCGDGK